MLHGELVTLRSRLDADVPVLHRELYEDVATRSAADSRPWVPLAEGAASPYAVTDGSTDAACFSVVERASEELAGEALLWGIDLHNRMAHVGISLRPGFRGRGLCFDALRVLSGYGFSVRGLHRLQVETLATNEAMIRAATRAGYTREAQTRESAWVNGAFEDEVVLGLLASQWSDRTRHGRGTDSH
jgi:RimJ/RimL family protein N-acetyltransferase